jgi:signal transduction histidine kinase
LENQDITNIKLLVTVGILITLFLAAVIIIFVVYYQRKMLLKEAHIQLMEQEKQIALFKASVEVEEKQKEKIARNLHDEINPLLVVLKLNLNRHRLAAKKNSFDPEALKLDSDLLDKAIEGIRTTCLDLIPSFLLEFGLLKALEEYVRTVQRLESMNAEFENNISTGELDIFDKQDQLNIYRICLEILNNLFKHSKCTEFKMTTQQIRNVLAIQFIHNGKGVTNRDMDVYTENSKGLGLKSLKARSLILGANIDYQITPTHAIINLTIPCKA